MFAGKKSAQIREILINESAWEEMTCLFALSLSRGDISKFSSTLDALRNHNISFDKTPHPPQEKLIAGLTEAIAAQTKSKFKNEN
ncbi:hypothetical protein [Klebsiella pneumoniae]|uniref:hypothetical protein n=1 Tax=Klebsiella pneumoniae TaxID=573 RepID=UPI0038BB45F9